MPELPEVETIRVSINKLKGQKIKTISLYQPNLREKVKDEIFLLLNKKINKIKRRAKYLIFRTEKGDILFHFGMSGFFKLFKKTNLPLLHKHDHVEFQFEKYILRFNDVRRFGLIQFHNDAFQSKQIKNLGLEPFDDAFNGEYFQSKLNKTSVTIKQSLMNSKIVVGIGNIYASEVLFLSGIHPLKKSSEVTFVQSQKLVHFIKKVLIQAIQKGGTTLKDYKQVDGKAGYFQQHLHVYNRKDLPCFSCQKEIQVIKISSRSSYFCAKCQKK